MKVTNNGIENETKDMTREFHKRDVLMTSEYMRICSTSLVNRQMQIKITLRYISDPSD